MKKLMVSVLILMILSMLLSGCFPRFGGSASSSSNTAKVSTSAPKESYSTLDEVISGTWKVYAGWDENGEMSYVADDWPEISLTFDANNGFTGTYRDSDVDLDASFSGTYDVSNYQGSEKDPYKWGYYPMIDKDSIVDSGVSTLITRLGGADNLYFSFTFREQDGEQMLYDEMLKLYFKR